MQCHGMSLSRKKKHKRSSQPRPNFTYHTTCTPALPSPRRPLVPIRRGRHCRYVDTLRHCIPRRCFTSATAGEAKNPHKPRVQMHDIPLRNEPDPHTALKARWMCRCKPRRTYSLVVEWSFNGAHDRSVGGRWRGEDPWRKKSRGERCRE
jgi:hypothetical protein